MMKIAISDSSRAQVTAAAVAAADRHSAAGGHVSGVGSVHGVHEATSRPDDGRPAQWQAFIGYRAVNGHDGAVNPMNAPARRGGRVNAVGRDDRHAIAGDPGGEAPGLRGVLPAASPPPYPLVDLENSGSGTPRTGCRETPVMRQHLRVSGQGMASLPNAEGGGGYDD